MRAALRASGSQSDGQGPPGICPEWIAERVGHTDGGALILKRYRHLYPSESYAAAPSLDVFVAER